MVIPVVAAPIVVVVLIVGLLGGGQNCDDAAGQGSSLSATADESIPPRIARIYIEIAGRWDIDVAFLASIGAQETGHGSAPTTYEINGSGCQGLMQLGVGGECGDYWGRNKCDGNGDGKLDVRDDWDNICAAAKGLRGEKKAPPAGGSEEAYHQAACNYYGACGDSAANYAAEVMARAKRYGFGNRGDNSALQAVGQGGQVLNLGDSLAVGSGPPLQRLREGGGVSTVAAEDRTSSQGLASLRNIDTVPKRIVVQLGTNDTSVGRFRRNVASVMAIARRADAEVVWVTIARPKLGGTTDSELNAVLEGATSRYPNLSTIDWKGAVSRDNITLSDGVHPNAEGYRARAELINSTLGASTAPVFAETGAGCTPTVDASLGKDEGGYAVDAGANRPGADLTPEMGAFMSAMAKLLPRPPIVTTGTEHSQVTKDGNVSDHYAGNGVDLGSVRNGFPATGGGYGDTIAAAALITAGVPRDRAAQIARSGTAPLPGGTWRGVHGGLRIQIIWKSDTGGNHFNHVHIGVARTAESPS